MTGQPPASPQGTPHAWESSHDPGPWALVAMLVSVAFLVAGVIWPGLAGSLLRVLMAGLALGFLASRALGLGLPSATVYDTYSPFEGSLADRSPPSAPDVVRQRAQLLSRADDPEAEAGEPVPWPVARELLRELGRRLENGHGLRLEHPTQATRIREMVSAPTRALLGLSETSGSGASRHPEDRFIPMADLDDVLDDLEKL